jgi:hypothetical protein
MRRGFAMRVKPNLPVRPLTKKELDFLKVGGAYVGARGYKIHLVSRAYDGERLLWVMKEWSSRRQGWVYRVDPDYLIKYTLQKRVKPK